VQCTDNIEGFCAFYHCRSSLTSKSLNFLAFHHEIVTFVTHLKLKYGNQYY